MKNKIILIMALFVISSISAALSFLSPEQVRLNNVIPASFYTQSLTDDETESIKYMREEEKLARDVYAEMYTKYNIRPFRNIKKAEQTHMDLMKDLLAKYSIDDPVSSDATGSFTNSELKDLYSKLIEQGNLSLVEALKVGALIEETDIADLDKQLKITQNKDIKETYDYLRYGSENHLRAFVRNLKANGVDYTPQLLPKEDFDKIIALDRSKNKDLRGKCDGTGRGRGNGRGNGMGKGDGKGNWNGYNCNFPERNCIYR
ncbi:MAG TPA: DUF2202 domain-containing protein [Ignavibacteria bacterium]|nr:DUF2202 domain-containing protein [Ignavibacteria bacterium]